MVIPEASRRGFNCLRRPSPRRGTIRADASFAFASSDCGFALGAGLTHGITESGSLKLISASLPNYALHHPAPSKIDDRGGEGKGHGLHAQVSHPIWTGLDP